VIVELDGSQHADRHSDAERDAALAADGWRVLRFWNNDVFGNADGVIAAIFLRSEERLPPGEFFGFVATRPARQRKKEEPPPAPPASAGGE